MSTENSADLETIAAELARTKAKIKAAEERLAKRTKPDKDRVKELEAQLTKHAHVGDNTFGNWHVKNTPSKDLAKDKLAEAYPQDEYPELWSSNILGGEVKKMIGENEYDAYRIPNGKSTITVTDVSDD